MKKLKLLFFFVMFVLNYSYGNDTTWIRTSAQCNSCKNRIETRLTKIKGIINSNLDVNTKELTVVFNKELISLDEIKTKLTEIGYDADGMIAKKAAYKRLPACCRKDYKGVH